MAGRLDGKVAIVTGAGASGPGFGNGKACAIHYAREGAKVFALDISASAPAEIERIRAERHAMILIGRMGDAFEIARAAAFLASDDASYITGTELIVDGGLTSNCIPSW